MKYKIKFLSSKKMPIWAGMNFWASKALHLKTAPYKNMKPNEILLDKEYPAKTLRKNLVHELTEAKLIKRGMSYPKAHRIALKTEKKVR